MDVLRPILFVIMAHEKLSEVILLRVQPSLKARVQQLADEEHLNLAQAFRVVAWRYFKNLPVSSTLASGTQKEAEHE